MTKEKKLTTLELMERKIDELYIHQRIIGVTIYNGSCVYDSHVMIYQNGKYLTLNTPQALKGVIEDLQKAYNQLYIQKNNQKDNNDTGDIHG